MRRSSKTKRIIPFKVKEISAMEKREKVVLEKTQKEGALLSAKIPKLESAITILENTIEKLDDKKTIKQAQTIEAENKYSLANLKLAGVYKEIEELVDKMEDLQRKFGIDKTHFDSILKETIENNSKKTKELEEIVKTLKAEVNVLTNDKNSLDSQIFANKAELEDGSNKLNGLNNYIKIANRNIEEKNKKIKTIQATLDSYVKEEEQKTDVISGLRTELENLAGEIETRNTVNDKLKKENKSLDSSKLTFYKRQKDVEEKAETVKRYYKNANVEIEL